MRPIVTRRAKKTARFADFTRVSQNGTACVTVHVCVCAIRRLTVIERRRKARLTQQREHRVGRCVRTTESRDAFRCSTRVICGIDRCDDGTCARDFRVSVTKPRELGTRIRFEFHARVRVGGAGGGGMIEADTKFENKAALVLRAPVVVSELSLPSTDSFDLAEERPPHFARIFEPASALPFILRSPRGAFSRYICSVMAAL